ncbi:MAG: FecR domain-containing protein [Verrucomicrobiota bacterium]
MNFGKSLFLLLVGCFAFNGFAAMEFKEADITTVKNIVERNEGSGAVPAKVNDKLRENSKVSTAAASMAELTFADSSITRMGANTQFSFQSKERLVKLEQGTVLIHTPPGTGGATVDCGGVTAAVSGTTFMASRDASGNAMFVLLEGQGGLKVTVGGSTAVLRPGQAASVGADAIQEAKSTASADAGSVAPAPGTSAAADDKKAGGVGGSGSSPASSGGGEGGTPPPAAAPKIQVFEVDVKKVVTSTPLIVEFKNELPSAPKIEKTIETQQVMVKEGKLESLGVEVVAVKSKDGDLLVGAPRVEKEEMVVLNKKVDVTGRGGPADSLDIDTAAGPGAGGGPARDARPVAQAAPAAPATPAPPPPTAPVINTVSQIATGTGTTVQAPTSLDLVINSEGLVRATLDRATRQAAPVGLFVPSMPGLVLSPSGLNIPAGATTTGDVALSLANPKNFFPGWDSADNLRPLTVVASAGSFSDAEATTALWPATAIRDANPVRLVIDPAGVPSKVLAALDAYFYFDSRAPGVTDGPSSFFSSAPSSLNLLGPSLVATELGIPWTTLDRVNNEEFRFYAAQNLEAYGSGFLNLTLPSPATDNMNKVLFGKSVRLGGSGSSFGNSSWNGANGIYDPANFGPPGTPNSLLGSWDEWAVTGSPGSPAAVGDRWRTWNDEGGSIPGAASLQFNWNSGSGSAPAAILMAGSDGVAATADFQMIGLGLNASQARLELNSAGSALIQSSRLANLKRDMGLGSGWDWSDANIEDKASFKLEAKEKVTLGATPAPTLTDAQKESLAEDKQVRIEALDTSGGTMAPTPADSLAVIRSGDSLELRNVVIRGFAGAKLEGAAGRVLVSGTTMRDFKIKELAGLAVNTDAKIQMAAVDSAGSLAGTMQVAEGLPVEKVATGQQVSVAVSQIQRRMEEVKLDANEVSLAANKIHIGADTLRTQISAQNLITLRANTVVMQNTFMSVVNNSGMINVYVRGVGGNLVNRAYGTLATDMLSFQGFNTFKIGSVAFDVRDQATLDAALLNRNINEVTGPGSAPQMGSLNVLQM